MERLANFIGNETQAPVGGRYLPVLDPATGSAIGEAPDSDVMDVVRALQAANKAAAAWEKTSGEKRAEALLRIATGIESAAEELASAESRAQGMPLKLARESSVARAAAHFRFYAHALLESDRPSRLTESQRLQFSVRQPLGVAAVITTWSDPLAQLSRRLAPLLAAGNAVIAKPSRSAPLSAAILGRIIATAGLPPGACNIVFGQGSTVGATLVSHPGIPVIAFTGRTETGKKIRQASAEFLKRAHLALGARNPALVFDDCDLEKVVPVIARAATQIHVDNCLRVSRIFVQERVYKDFLDRFKAALETLPVGRPGDGSTILGPLPSAAELERHRSAVRQGVAEKGKLLCGGEEAPSGLESGFYARPTALYDLTLCSTLQQEDVTGPLVTIASFKYQHDAIKHANTSPYGQAAYVWTESLSRALKVAPKLEAGRVFVNGAAGFEPRQSWLPQKASGVGRDGGLAALDAFSAEAAVSFSV